MLGNLESKSKMVIGLIDCDLNESGEMAELISEYFETDRLILEKEREIFPLEEKLFQVFDRINSLRVEVGAAEIEFPLDRDQNCVSNKQTASIQDQIISVIKDTPNLNLQEITIALTKYSVANVYYGRVQYHVKELERKGIVSKRADKTYCIPSTVALETTP